MTQKIDKWSTNYSKCPLHDHSRNSKEHKQMGCSEKIKKMTENDPKTVMNWVSKYPVGFYQRRHE